MKITFDDDICIPYVKISNNRYKTFVERFLAVVEEDFNAEFDIHIQKFISYFSDSYNQVLKDAYIISIKVIDRDHIFTDIKYGQLYIYHKTDVNRSFHFNLFRRIMGLEYETANMKKSYYQVAFKFWQKFYSYKFNNRNITSCLIQLDMGDFEKLDLDLISSLS